MLCTGDSLATATTSSSSSCSGIASIPIVSPRKSIRDYSDHKADTSTNENSFLLYRGRKSYLMVPVLKALTWFTSEWLWIGLLPIVAIDYFAFVFTEISIYYHLESLGKYHLRRIVAYLLIVLFAGLINDFLLTPPSPLPNSVLDFIHTNLKTGKRNFLNVYFVKWGWLWTYIALIPFFVFTRFYFVKRSLEKEQKLYQYSKTPKRKKSVHFREPLEEGAGDDTHRDSVDQVEKKAETVEQSDQLPPRNDILYFVTQLGWLIVPTLVRLAISTVIWSVSVNFFVNLHHSKSACHFSSNSSKLYFFAQKIDIYLFIIYSHYRFCYRQTWMYKTWSSLAANWIWH